MENFHEGKALKDAIALDERSLKDIAKEINVHRATIYNLFKEKSIEKYYILRFEKVGIHINNAATNVEQPDKPQGNSSVEARLLLIEKQGLEVINKLLIAQNDGLIADKLKLIDENKELKEMINSYKKAENLTSKEKAKK